MLCSSGCLSRIKRHTSCRCDTMFETRFCIVINLFNCVVHLLYFVDQMSD